MEPMDLSRPRGTRDFSPSEMAKRRRVEASMRAVFHSHGYGEVQTPSFEHADLFIVRSGVQILEQIYDFRDKSDRHMALRPELTAPVMRYFASELKNDPKPLRLFYFGNCFRYERPQMGRYREFWQMGMEYIGKRTTLADAEVISIAIQALQASGAREFLVRIGHVKLLAALLKGYGIDPTKDKDAMIAIDKKDRDAIASFLSNRTGEDRRSFIDLVTTLYTPSEAFGELQKMAEYHPGLIDYCNDIKGLLSLLEGIDASIFFDPSISRGLDYYDGMVFEIDIPSLGAEKQVCGGGAYSLSSVFGGEVDGIGFAIGFDRVLVALGDDDSPKVSNGVYVIPMGEEAYSVAFKLQRDLVSKGHVCVMETQGRNLKKALSAASSAGIRHAVILGSDEILNGQATLKDLLTGIQIKVNLGSVHEHIILDV